MIPDFYFWSIAVTLSLGTLLIRGSIIALASRVKIPDRVKETFSFIPAAILPAFMAPIVFFHKGEVEWAFGKERLLILLLAVVVCYYKRSTLLTIVFGLGALFFLTQL